MRVIFSHYIPFFLAHGGSQTLIEELMAALKRRGIEAEPERWWDENQSGDILHFISRPRMAQIRLAKQKGFKTVLTDLLDQTASRSKSKLFAQRAIVRFGRRFGQGFLERLAWDAYEELDAMVFAVSAEWDTVRYLFDATPGRGHVIGWGMRAEVLESLAQPAPEEDYLISMATIAPRKNTLELARAAKAAGTPIVFTGKPYAADDPYFKEFQSLVDGRIVRYAGFVDEERKRQLLRSARGFVLLSQFESGCVAVYEASAAGLPLLLSDLPWARFGYPGADPLALLPLGSHQRTVEALKTFYASAHRMKRTTFPILTWDQIADRYIEIYKTILAEKRP